MCWLIKHFPAPPEVPASLGNTCISYWTHLSMYLLPDVWAFLPEPTPQKLQIPIRIQILPLLQIIITIHLLMKSSPQGLLEPVRADTGWSLLDKSPVPHRVYRERKTATHSHHTFGQFSITLLIRLPDHRLSNRCSHRSENNNNLDYWMLLVGVLATLVSAMKSIFMLEHCVHYEYTDTTASRIKAIHKTFQNIRCWFPEGIKINMFLNIFRTGLFHLNLLLLWNPWKKWIYKMLIRSINHGIWKWLVYGVFEWVWCHFSWLCDFHTTSDNCKPVITCCSLDCCSAVTTVTIIYSK